VSAARTLGGIAATLGLFAAGCGGSDFDPGLLEPPESVTLLDIQSQIFSTRCALSGCHTGTTAPFGLDLTSLASSSANLLGVPSGEVPGLLRVEPFDATDSYLYMKLTADPRIEGDPMPALGEPLNAGQLALIETWINGGANQ
jgi:hypothetical protein